MVYQSSQPLLEFPEFDLYSFFFRRKQRAFPADKIIYSSAENRERSYTYEEVSHYARLFAYTLQKHLDFEPGQVVAFISQNDVDEAPVLLGTWYAGGTGTAMNPGYSVQEMSHQLIDSGAKVVVAHPNSLDNAVSAAALAGIAEQNVLILGEIMQAANFKHWKSFESLDGLPLEDALSPVQIADPKATPAFLPYSSGTTGTPKGVVLTHHNLTSNILQTVQQYEKYLSWNGGPDNTISDVPPAPAYNHETREGGDRLLAALPEFHVYGLMFELLIPLWMGTTAFLMARYKTNLFAHNIKELNITKIFVVPPILIWLLNDANKLTEELGEGWSKGVRMCMSGAAPLAPELAHHAWDILGWRIIQGYGMSEVSPVLTLQDLSDWRTASVGKLVSGIEAKIIRLDDSYDEVEAGEQGELIVRGPNVFIGYLNREEATKACLSKDGWFGTGDIGYFEKDTQRLFITDRLKDMIKYHGFQVAPAELEAVLLECPLVADVGVVGIACPAEGTEVPRAYCVREGGPSEVGESDSETVAQWIQARLAKHKWIRGGVVWISAIPKSPTGKILRRQMRIL